MKTLSTDPGADMSACELKGDEAAGLGDYEYALDLYEDALALQPRNLPLRGKLRHMQIQAHACRGGLARSSFSTMVLTVSARLKRDPNVALGLSERLMRRNPFDPRVVGTLVTVADKAGRPEIALQALEILLEEVPNSDFLLNAMADRKRSLGDARGEYECLSVLAKVRRNDAALTRRLKDTAARAALLHADWNAPETAPLNDTANS